MKNYSVENIRNICLMGHGNCGKTTLAEAIMFYGKATDRLGKIAEGNTISDFDQEETKRLISVSTSLLPLEWKDTKLNIIDVPGTFDFEGEAVGGIRAADSCFITISGKSGIGVGTEKAWKAASKRGMARAFVVSKLDEESADYYKTLTALRDMFGISICPVTAPVIEGEKLIGIASIISGKVYEYDKNGAAKEIPVPASMAGKMEELKAMMNEAVAETDEALMEKFFAEEPFTEEEINKGLKSGIAENKIVPVAAVAAVAVVGIDQLLDIMLLAPTYDKAADIKAMAMDGSEIKLNKTTAEPLSLMVFKTVSDPFVGKLSYFKVMSGVAKKDAQVINTSNDSNEKLGHIFVVKGKKQTETDMLTTGDIGAVTKLSYVNTGDSLCDSSKKIKFEAPVYSSPCLSVAIYPKQKGDEDKIANGLNKIMEEDSTIKFGMNTETHQQILSGLGDVHIDVTVSKLKSKFNVAVESRDIKVAYRETIRKKVKVEGKHKKQSGGHGQFGHVWIEFEPGDTPELQFNETVFGGSVPKNFFPAVEKGLQDSIKKGVLAGYPVVNLKATLVDGSYHPVDSSEMAFKMAASQAFKAGMAQATTVLLEPIGYLKVYVPDQYMGDVIGDINKSRGQVIGMGPADDGLSEVTAYVPMSEMHKYSITLRSMTRGRGHYNLAFERYDEAPPPIAAKVVEEAKKQMTEDDNDD